MQNKSYVLIQQSLKSSAVTIKGDIKDRYQLYQLWTLLRRSNSNTSSALIFWKAFYSFTVNSTAVVDPDGMPWIKMWIELIKKCTENCNVDNQKHLSIIKL